MKPNIFLTLLMLFSVLTAKADTFTVVSNADSGPGSFREAIGLANANGTGVMDFIYFNMPDQSEAGRTINLQTELPGLSSNITIDGTTQPGTNLGISSARVTLYLDHYTSIPFTFLFIHNASGINIYGMCFKFFQDPDVGGGSNYAIGLRNASQIRVGAAGKGNLISAVRSGITNVYWNYFEPDSAKDITIQGNVFGLNSNNVPVKGGAIELRGVANLVIGGPAPTDGNLHIRASISLVQIFNTASAFFVKMQHSRVNINWDGSVFFYNNSGSVQLTGNNMDDSLTTKTEIRDNQFCGVGLTGLGLAQISHRAILQGNKFGLNETGAACWYNPYHITISSQCKNVVIGGYTAAEQNIIHGSIYGMQRHGIHVLQNQISGIIQNPGTAAPDPFIRITEYDNNQVKGVSNSLAKIQLYTTECPFNSCFLKRYLAVTWADAAGNWSYPVTAATPNLVATATIADSSTSAFTEVNVDHFNYRVIKDATCGQSNGSITGIRVYAGTHIRWYNNSNVLVGTDTNLVNVPAGTYYLQVSNGLTGCIWGVSLTIYDISPPVTLNPAPVVTNAGCGQGNGSISHTTYSNFRNVWCNNSMDSVGNGSFINGLAPGNYFLKLICLTDTGCKRIYGPFTVSNISGPSLNTNAVSILPATCGNNNGAIGGITASGVTGTPFIAWVDSLNTVYGSSLNANNLPAGRYRLKFKDASTCDTIITAYFTVPAQGIINLDISTMLITGSDCGSSNGSIRQISQTGATAFQWINAAGLVVGNTIDLNAVPAGKYVLKATNVTGCTAQTDSISVPNAPFIADLGMLQFTMQAGRCNRKDGYYTVGNFPNPQLYSFYWVDSLQPAIIIGTGLSLTGINSGTYFLFAKNMAGCEEKIVTARIPYLKPVQINASGVQANASTCGLNNGSITGMGYVTGSGPGPFVYTWYDYQQAVAGSQQQLVNVPAGSYRLVITDINACTDTSNYILVSNTNTVLPKPIYLNQNVRIGTTAILTVQNPQTGIYSLFDAPAATIPVSQNNTGTYTISPVNKDATYYVEFTGGTCTSERAAVDIKAFDITAVFVPGAFTPNNDSRNEVLYPMIIGQAAIDYFIIYNPYGQVVYSSRAALPGWDGSFKGKPQAAGTYVWIFKGRDKFNGRAINDKGSFVLIR